MAGPKLAVTTVVKPQEGDATTGFVILGPGDEVPDWALDQLGAHCFEDGKHPSESKPASKAAPKAPAKD